jgi:hypothetical protein
MKAPATEWRWGGMAYALAPRMWSAKLQEFGTQPELGQYQNGTSPVPDRREF